MDLNPVVMTEHGFDGAWRGPDSDAVLELNHRVANNLQLVSSYLSLQERDVEDPSAKRALKAAAARLAAVGQVHRALLRGRAPTVELRSLLTSICTHAGEAAGVSVNVTGDTSTLPAEVAQALGIAVNELILNAAKHAYDGRGGVIDVSCRNSPCSILIVTVSDQGAGLPDPDEMAASPGVGMTIIRSEVRRLGGSLTFDNAGGTRATLAIPLRSDEPDPVWQRRSP